MSTSIPTAFEAHPQTPAAIASVSERAARAHEHKNCLSIILAVASLVTPELGPESRARMERLRAAVGRMRDLLDDDLGAAGGTTETLVEALLDGVCESLRDRADAAQVALVVRCSGGTVRARTSELSEALLNLVSNAIDATPPNRAVVIDAERDAAGGHEWRIRDHGVGMPPEILERIGVPYRSSRLGGTGLGVALARAVVERHGGTVRFDSVRGSGTTVTIRLPRGRAACPLRRRDARSDERALPGGLNDGNDNR